MQHSHPFFSIIIPVYNVENYITRCLNSCINQSFQDLEILIIDDCGEDSSIQIVKEFAKKDKRIKILKHSQNLGLFHTRITGEKKARGTYIISLDSDDFMDLDACKKIYDCVQKAYRQNGVWMDLLYSPFIQKENISQQTKKQIEQTNLWQKIVQSSGWNVCNKVFHQNIIKKSLDFIEKKLFDLPKLNMAEDALKFFIIMIFAKNAMLIDGFYHYYCDNPHSIIQSDKQNLKNILKDYQNVLDALDLLCEKALKNHQDAQKNKKMLKKTLQKYYFEYKKVFYIYQIKLFLHYLTFGLIDPNKPLRRYIKSLAFCLMQKR